MATIVTWKNSFIKIMQLINPNYPPVRPPIYLMYRLLRMELLPSMYKSFIQPHWSSVKIFMTNFIILFFIKGWIHYVGYNVVVAIMFSIRGACKKTFRFKKSWAWNHCKEFQRLSFLLWNNYSQSAAYIFKLIPRNNTIHSIGECNNILSLGT